MPRRPDQARRTRDGRGLLRLRRTQSRPHRAARRRRARASSWRAPGADDPRGRGDRPGDPDEQARPRARDARALRFRKSQTVPPHPRRACVRHPAGGRGRRSSSLQGDRRPVHLRRDGLSPWGPRRRNDRSRPRRRRCEHRHRSPRIRRARAPRLRPGWHGRRDGTFLERCGVGQLMAERASAITSRIVGITDRLRPQRHGSVDADSLAKEILRHYPEGDAELVRRAYAYAAEAHEGQKRISGEPYITHPAAVAMLVAELGMDAATVAAALLHDVPEDTAKSVEDVRREFGEEIGRLVDGVTKLSRLSGQSRDEHQAENIRKMLLAMADDLRVVIIKLCDRLHNMRTLAPLPPDKQKRIARQTMDIYAPLAHRLGIWQIKWELEDLAFKYLEPEQYREVAEQLAARRQVRERYINETMKTLEQELKNAGIRADLSGRAKHLWSIAQKMRRKGVGFEEVYDVLAIRVIVDDVPSCYVALGVVHTLWPPIPGQFDDYIAVPKANMYQSLHTAVIGTGGQPVEIQVRTRDMHDLAEYGIAAHWRYKEGGKGDRDYESKLAWVRQLLEWQHDVADAQEFVESLKVDVFQDQVFVFTPKGEVKGLPAGSTPIDFAYRIHTDVGRPLPPDRSRGGVNVKGVTDLLIRFGVCCNPVPGDKIVGYITRGRGVTVHRADCSNVKGSADKERFVDVEWESSTTRTYPVAIRIEGWDRDGFLRDVASVISENQVQLLALSAQANPDKTATVNATLQVTSVEQLSRVLAKLEGVRDVFTVHRDGR